MPNEDLKRETERTTPKIAGERPLQEGPPATGEQASHALSPLLEQVLGLWVKPEIVRRQEAGKIPCPFGLRAAQVIMNIGGGPPVVRLNEEVRAVLRAKARRTVRRGEPVYWDDFSDIDNIELTDNDPNAGGVTILWHEGRCLLQFDFRYNAQRIADVIKAAQEFIDAAKSCLEAGNLRPFADNLFSATELTAKGVLLMHPDEKLLASRKHAYIAQHFNKWRRLGNAKPEHAKLLNDLSKLRSSARYLDAPLSLTAPQAQALLSTAESMIADLRAEAPTRAPTSRLRSGTLVGDARSSPESPLAEERGG